MAGWAWMACPRCGRGDGLLTVRANLGSGAFLCARCGHHGDASVSPDRYRGVIPLAPAWWDETAEARDEALADAKLNIAQAVLDAERVGLSDVWFDDGESAPDWQSSLVFPCYIPHEDLPQSVFALPLAANLVEQNPIIVPGMPSLPWGWQEVGDEEVIFVDHPLDRLAMIEAGVANVVCLPPGMNPLLPNGGDWTLLARLEEKLRKLGRIVLALRDDDPSHRLEEELARRLGKERCFRTRWQKHRVPQEVAGAYTVLGYHGADGLRQAVEQVSAYPVVGVHELFDVEDRFEVLYEFGLQPGVSTGWPSLDLNYTVKPGQWTVVTGIPGHGKSTFMDAMMVNLAKLHGWTFGIFSPENQPIERHYANLMEKAAGLPFNEGPTPRISVETKNELKGFLNDHFKIILPDEEDGNWTLDSVLNLARTLVYRHGIRGLVIDPWNELDHSRPPMVSETDHISGCLTKIRRFARLYGVHVWVVAHPTKLEPKADGQYPIPTPYMIAGGAHWRNKSDNALSLFRYVGREDEDVTDVYVQKIRFKEVGKTGRVSLRGDFVCGRYIDDINQTERARCIEKGLAIASRNMRVAERTLRQDDGMQIQTTGDPLAGRYG